MHALFLCHHLLLCHYLPKQVTVFKSLELGWTLHTEIQRLTHIKGNLLLQKCIYTKSSKYEM